MERKSFPSFLKQIEGRAVTGFASIFGILDEGFDVVHKGAFKKTINENIERIRHLWGHDSWMPPIAKITELREVGKGELPKELKEKYPEATGGLLVTREYLDTPRGDEVFAGVQSGAINEMSFGYDPVKFDFEEVDESDSKGALIRNLRELRLWDTSDVVWGMNPATVASKATVPFKDTGAADEGKSWSKPNLGDFTDESFDDLSDAEKSRIAAHYAWNIQAKKFEGFSLPHHQYSREGVGPAVWAGVEAAMKALLGADGGVDIPDGDRKAVYNHLSKHYAAWDKEPPDYKLIELATAARAVLELDLDSGFLSTETGLEELTCTLDLLNEILTTAEPPKDDETSEALTEQILLKLELYKRDPILFSVR